MNDQILNYTVIVSLCSETTKQCSEGPTNQRGGGGMGAAAPAGPVLKQDNGTP